MFYKVGDKVETMLNPKNADKVGADTMAAVGTKTRRLRMLSYTSRNKVGTMLNPKDADKRKADADTTAAVVTKARHFPPSSPFTTPDRCHTQVLCIGPQ